MTSLKSRLTTNRACHGLLISLNSLYFRVADAIMDAVAVMLLTYVTREDLGRKFVPVCVVFSGIIPKFYPGPLSPLFKIEVTKAERQT